MKVVLVSQCFAKKQIEFEKIRKDIADQTLDEVNNVLGRIANAYKDYVRASTLKAEKFGGDIFILRGIQSEYKEAFRYVRIT